MAKQMRYSLYLSGILVLSFVNDARTAEHSIARRWNEALLAAVRKDFARPTVHARNLFHASIALYDLWAIFDEKAETYLLGKTVGGFNCGFDGISVPDDLDQAYTEAMSYAAYNLLVSRFSESPGIGVSLARFDALMDSLGLDATFQSVDYSSGSPAALGNHMAQCVIDFGLQDGANERQRYQNRFYTSFNPALIATTPGNPKIIDPNFWQPLAFADGNFVDQSGNALPGEALPFLGAEWGKVVPFALSRDDLTIHERGGHEYWGYHDPGPPPHLATGRAGAQARHRYRSSYREASEEFKWGFALVSVWSAHLDPSDGIVWDISPASLGNSGALPGSFEEYRDFYKLFEGGDTGAGYEVNPHTGQPYVAQIVPRADYARVLAEFWADGPDSETPPGHWFSILNYVSDHPLSTKRFRGAGARLDAIEWDVKAYFALGGAVHDAAIAAWGLKGWYDYVRPISAIRWMADAGQSSDPERPRFHQAGLPLIDGYIELVDHDDVLAGEDAEHVGKVKLYAWRGPGEIVNPASDVAGVGWILAENWWPYHRPNFITPPFAGYVSGHSTFSRAAAEVMGLLTGDEFFPGGLGEFSAAKKDFLVFEAGPSVDLTLQWATYRDAADQTSLSRIWGGIHPPADDIPGRIIGERVGIDAFRLAEGYFGSPDTAVRISRVGELPENFELEQNAPNPFNSSTSISFSLPHSALTELTIFNTLSQRVVTLLEGVRHPGTYVLTWDGRNHTGELLPTGVYFSRLRFGDRIQTRKLLLLR